MRLIIFVLIVLFVSTASNAQKSVQDYLKALETAKTDSAKGKLCWKIGLKYYAKDNSKAREYTEKAISYYEKIDIPKGHGLSLQLYGYILEQFGENFKAIDVLKKSNKLFERAKYYKGIVVNYSVIGYCFEKEGKLDQALNAAITSLEIIDAQNLPETQKAKNLVDLARIYRVNNQLQKSIDTYNKALVIAKAKEDHDNSLVIQMNIGNVYFDNNDYKQALQYYSKALKETEFCDCNDRKSLLWANIGFAHYHLKNVKKLKNATDRAEIELTGKPSLGLLTDIEILKGASYQLNNKHEKAIQHLEKALKLAQANNFKEKLVMVSSVLSKSYVAEGKEAKLDNLIEETISTTDSMYNKDVAKSIAEMEIRYETKLKEQKLNEVTTQNALKEKYIKDIEVRNRWLIALLIIGLLLAAVSFWLFIRSRKTTKELATLLDQKKLLLKEIHHRVKNNLQTVSSLLNLQTRASNSQVVRKAMVEGQTRLKSISLLHQKLYQHDELTKIEMDGYTNDLAQYIIKNFNSLNKKIELNTNAKGITLDLDTAIPLGLILNELITNSIKYSFADVDEGEMEVSIKQLDTPNNYELKVSDNGKGLPQNLDIETLPSMGLKLVKSLSRQIHGSFETVVDSKAHFIIKFKETIA
jgi:two-component sensor histidine kinase